MSVEEARRTYSRRSWSMLTHASACRVSTLAGFAAGFLCLLCELDGLEVEAAALALDMANAQASDERIRGSVAW